MIYYPKTALKTVNILEYGADNGYNCIFSNNKISPVGGFADTDFNIPAGVVDFKKINMLNIYLAVAPDGAYVSEINEQFTKFHSFTEGEPYIVEDFSSENRAAIICGKDLIYYTAKGFRLAKADVVTRKGIMRHGRIFALDDKDKFILRWTDFGAEDWSAENGGGWFKVNSERGEILNLFDYNGKLILLREYGITVISAFGVAENFKMQAEFSTDRIFENSAAVVCGKLYFFTAAGLYSFDGTSVEWANWRYSRHITPPFCAISCGNVYYISCNTDLFEQNVIAFYNVLTKECGVLNRPAEKLFSFSGNLYAYHNGKVYKADGKPSKFVWRSDEVCFGFGGKKVIRNLLLKCVSPVDITVDNGATTRKFTAVNGENLNVRLCGKTFKFTLESSKEITSFKAVAELHDGI